MTIEEGGNLSYSNVATGGVPPLLPKLPNGGPSAAFSPDGTKIVTMDWVFPATARVWDATTGAELQVWHGPMNSVLDMAWSPDGTQIAVVLSRHIIDLDSDDPNRFTEPTVRIWDVATGKDLLVLPNPEDSMVAVAWSPDSTQIVSRLDRTAQIWDAATGAVLLDLRGHDDRVSSAVFSPDGRRVVTASDDKTARVWDAQTDPRLIKARAKRRVFRELTETERRTFKLPTRPSS